MTLTKQLWLVIFVLMTLVFISSFLISVYTARNYFLEQLTVKNIDNATNLALSLSQLDKDPTSIELMISAQFDAGHYKRIELTSPDGETIQSRKQSETEAEVPSWFSSLMALEVPPGVAQVQDGWKQYGTLRIESETAYALRALWRVFYQLLMGTIGIALIVGLIGSMLLHRITRPLRSVVEQAEAIGDRRFVTSAEPRTLEFKRVVRAMNALTGRLRTMLEVETQRLEEMKRESQLDPATGVVNRQQFFRLLDVRLNLSDDSVRDALLLLRITDLQSLNSRLGRVKVDEWILSVLESIRSQLERRSDHFSHFTLGRLNGSDFVLLISDTSFLSEVSEAVWKAANSATASDGLDDESHLALVGSAFRPGEQRSILMARLDDLLATVEQAPSERFLLADEEIKAPLFRDAEGWRHALREALGKGRISHVCYPVVTRQGKVFHEEAMLRITLAGQEVRAGAVIGWARRLNLLHEIDLQLLRSVLDELKDDDRRKIAVNLSSESLRDASSHLALIDCIQRHDTSVARRLSLELNEHVAVKYAEPLSMFAAAVKPHGVMIGLQSAGKDIAKVPRLETLGLDYLKVDASLIQHSGSDVSGFLRGLCKLGHSLGLVMIAEGVLEGVDRSDLVAIGFDAFTGPGVLSIDTENE